MNMNTSILHISLFGTFDEISNKWQSNNRQMCKRKLLFSTNVRSVSDYYTGITPNLIRATAKAAVTTQEAPSQSSKEPKHGRLFRDIT